MKKKVLLLYCFVFFYHNLFAEEMKISRFISAETCGECHSKIYNEWRDSLHNLAHKDEIYREVALKTLQGADSKEEKMEAEMCVKCHIPIGFVSNKPSKTSEDTTLDVETPSGEGVQCDYCHSTLKITKRYNNGLFVVPGNGEEDPGTKRGPYEDSESDFHQTAFSKPHKEASFCGSCHNVKHVAFGTNLETTFDEWEKSPYNSQDNSKRVTCQGCHMYQREGFPATGMTKRPKNKGFASDEETIEREHIATHYFMGGNSYINSDKDKQKMVEARLKNAATLGIDIKKKEIVVKVTNSGAGHSIPTGLTNLREMWLEVTVFNKKGEEIYSFGKLDKNGYLDKNTELFNTIFGDGSGKAVFSVAEAKEIIKDNRIEPFKTFEKKLPFLKEASNIKIRLLYRIVSQKLVDDIFGKGKHFIPVVVMAELKENIKD